MRIRGNTLRVLFAVALAFYIYCVLSPWAWKFSQSMRAEFGSSGNDFYWSFQACSYRAYSGISWDFYFNPQQRSVLWDFWFARETYYYGFTYEWIRIFAFQLLTVASGVFVLMKRSHEARWMLVPVSFSIISEFLGVLVVARYMYVWHGYANPSWGLPFAMFSTLGLVMLFLTQYALERRARRNILLSKSSLT